eukprot:gene9563-19867_t
MRQFVYKPFKYDLSYRRGFASTVNERLELRRLSIMKCVDDSQLTNTEFKLLYGVKMEIGAPVRTPPQISKVLNDRPIGGPKLRGKRSNRNFPLILSSFYNRWKIVHGIKFQTVNLPNGMFLHVCGSVSCRHNDNFCLDDGGLEEKLEMRQEGGEIKYCIYAYTSTISNGGYIHSGYRSEVLTDQQKYENKGMKICRQSIQWDHGTVTNLVRFITFNKGLRLRQSMVDKSVFVSFLLTNAYSCINGIETTEHFECQPPYIFEWAL